MSHKINRQYAIKQHKETLLNMYVTQQLSLAAVASLQHGRRFIGTELSELYTRLGNERVREECSMS